MPTSDGTNGSDLYAGNERAWEAMSQRCREAMEAETREGSNHTGFSRRSSCNSIGGVSCEDPYKASVGGFESLAPTLSRDYSQFGPCHTGRHSIDCCRAIELWVSDFRGHMLRTVSPTTIRASCERCNYISSRWGLPMAWKGSGVRFPSAPQMLVDGW